MPTNHPHHAITETEGIDRERREAIADTRGALSGVFGPRYLQNLREDWPE